MTGPGYATPNTTAVEGFNLEVGKRSPLGVINWRPVGGYLEASMQWTWGIDPGAFVFDLPDDHPICDFMSDVRETAFHFRLGRAMDGTLGYHGKPFTGRVMRRQENRASHRVKFSGVDYRWWLKRMLAWVNNQFPAEIQFSITGKQDVRFGSVDSVFKRYLSSVATRLDKPVFAAMPIRQPESWEPPELDDIDSLEDLLDIILDAAEDVIGLQARFTYLDELFRPTVERLEIGVSVDLWDGRGTSPTVFNTSTLADLQSVIDYTGDNFLDLSKLAGIGGGLWSNTMDRAGYVFDTHAKRDNRKVQFRTDAKGQIVDFDHDQAHCDATRAVVGGKSPAILNDIIEIGANLAISLLLNLLAPGLGLGVVVGDLFDDIFFAYQVFWDNELEDRIGQEDAFPEVFADNTAAWSLDASSVGQNALKEHSGQQSLVVKAMSGIPGIGNSFGADDGSARRYDVGDIITLWDRGNTVEQYVSAVTVSDRPGARMREEPVLGSDKRLKGPYDRLYGLAQGIGGALNGIANSV